MNKTLVFIAGYIAGVISMVMLLDMQHYTVALALNYQIMKPMLNQIFGYVFICLMFIVCFGAVRPSVQTVVVTHDQKKS